MNFLAVAIGTAHGVYKEAPKLDVERLSEIRKVVDIPLVLHGTSGVPDEAVRECIRGGICKVNYATDLRTAFTIGVNQVASKGYEETSISDIMDIAGGAKGMLYRFFQSKEDVMRVLGNQMFFENNPFDAIRKRNDLNGLQKIKELLVLNQSDAERNQQNMQAIPILKDPHILAAAVEENRRVLTPLWLELLEEGILSAATIPAIVFSPLGGIS